MDPKTSDIALAENEKLRAEVALLTKHAKEGWDLAATRTSQWKAAELEADQLFKEVVGYRKVLWVLARNAGLSLHVPMADLIKIPEEAELLSWHEPIFDAMILKGICSHADCAPSMSAKPVFTRTKEGK